VGRRCRRSILLRHGAHPDVDAALIRHSAPSIEFVESRRFGLDSDCHVRAHGTGGDCLHGWHAPGAASRPRRDLGTAARRTVGPGPDRSWGLSTRSIARLSAWNHARHARSTQLACHPARRFLFHVVHLTGPRMHCVRSQIRRAQAWNWMACCTATGVAAPAIIALGMSNPSAAAVPFALAGVVAFGWLSEVSRVLLSEKGDQGESR
jgi:hypothetical protein